MIGCTVSHYEILEEVGAGAMGRVYRAIDNKLKRPTALKFLSVELTRDPVARKRFEYEAQAASALDHPNICTIFEIDEVDDGRLFIAMACYEETLRERIGRGAISLEQALQIIRQICEGLNKTHEAGLVHRDIKPSNIMFSSDDIVKVMDFGVAKLAGPGPLTNPGTIVGTTSYMSPEQVRGEDVDHRSDIWSVGVILYEMLSRRLPLRGDSIPSCFHSILNAAPPPLDSINPTLPVSLRPILERVLSKDRDLRHEDSLALYRDLSGLEISLEAPTVETVAAKKEPTSSIAVLPFTNLSADPDQEYFCDGIVEELINSLAHVQGLRVVARTSSFVFKGKKEDIREIGGKLGVETLLEGSVRKVGGRLRVMAQLVKVEDGFHLWSERFDKNIEDVFAIQDEISEAIVENLKIQLHPAPSIPARRRTHNPEAYTFYLQGRYFWNTATWDNCRKAIRLYERAIEKDPSFAPAYVGLADIHLFFFPSSASSEEMYQKAKVPIDKALELDPMLAEAHSSLAWLRYYFHNDLEGAEREFIRALELAPSYAMAHRLYSDLLGEKGRFDEALGECQLAYELDPLSIRTCTYLSMMKRAAWCWSEAEELLEQALEIEPDHSYVHAKHAILLSQMGRDEASLEKIDRALDLDPTSGAVLEAAIKVLGASGQTDRTDDLSNDFLRFAPNYWYAHAIAGDNHQRQGRYGEASREFDRALKKANSLNSFRVEFRIGINQALAGDREAAEKTLSRFLEQSRTSYFPPYILASLYLALGDVESGFEWLERAYETHDPRLCNLRMNFLLDGLRSDPRYKALWEKMGLELRASRASC